MFTVLVNLRVRPDRVAEFEDAIEVNAHASLRDEPGCLVFDVHRSTSDPLDYLLYEVYTDEDAFSVAHRAAAHYAAWQQAAARTLAGERTNSYYHPVIVQSVPSGPSVGPGDQPGVGETGQEAR